MPTSGEEPQSPAKPCGAPAFMTSRERAPAWARARPFSGSISTPFISDVLTRSVPERSYIGPAP